MRRSNLINMQRLCDCYVLTSFVLAMTLFTRPLPPAPHLGRGNETVFSRFTSHFSRKILLPYYLKKLSALP